jgi:hypothetical protein
MSSVQARAGATGVRADGAWIQGEELILQVYCPGKRRAYERYVEEAGCLIHAPNESVDSGELERIARAEALFLRSSWSI